MNTKTSNNDLRPLFPFSAVLGQEEMKLALILNTIDPGIGGVLARGEKGTAKSTTVRALAGLLPTMETVRGCPFGCDPARPWDYCDYCLAASQNGGLAGLAEKTVPVVDLPLNATEDMLLGGLDFSKAVKTGQKAFMPGLLARANRGFIYVDEVNLLDDHLVDVLLDAAASGVNTLEREGISFSHPSRFVLVGTMNPEEGELRPQLLDRFGLCVEVAGETDLALRVDLMRAREAFDQDPGEFKRAYEDSELKTADTLVKARKLLSKVRLPKRLKGFISSLCVENHVAGHRADLALQRAALALAAYEGRTEVSEEDISRVAAMALRHRKRDALPPPPPEPPRNEPEQGEEEQDQNPPEEDQQPDQPDQPEPQNEDQSQDDDQGGEDDNLEGFDLPQPEPEPEPEPEEPKEDQSDDQGKDPVEQVFEVGQTFKVRKLSPPRDRKLRRGSGRRSLTRTAQKQGRYVKSALYGDPTDLALDATLRAAAPYQLSRKSDNGPLIKIASQDIRLKVREKRVGNFLLFLVDASGSMGARARMTATKGAVLSLLLDAYQKRDKVSMVTFRGKEADVSLPCTNSIELAARLLEDLPVGGRTPLSAGLLEAAKQVSLQLAKDPDIRPLVLVLTDGKANTGLGQDKPPHEEALALASKMGRDERVRYVVVDTEPQGIVCLGLALKLSQALNADYFKIEDLKAEDLVEIAQRKNQ